MCFICMGKSGRKVPQIFHRNDGWTARGLYFLLDTWGKTKTLGCSRQANIWRCFKLVLFPFLFYIYLVDREKLAIY